jgi:hypothetical protein
MPDGICVFRSSTTVKIAYDGYYTEACGIDICHADCEPGEKNNPLTVSVGRGTSGSRFCEHARLALSIDRAGGTN